MTPPIFSYMPIDAFADKRLTLEQLRVLGVLFSFRGKNSDTVWPSRQEIAKRCGMHLSNISTATSALERLGWLTKDGKGGYSKATRYTITVPETVAQSATVADATVAEQATRPVADSATRMPLAESATRKEVNQEHTNGTDQGGARPSKTISKTKTITLRTYIEQRQAAGMKPISADDPIFTYAGRVGLTDEMLTLAWHEFKRYWITGAGKAKRKADWPTTYRNAVEQNRAHLWFIREGEEAQWTTVGEQARRAAA